MNDLPKITMNTNTNVNLTTVLFADDANVTSFLIIIDLLLKIYRNNFISWLALYVYLGNTCNNEFNNHWFYSSIGFSNYQQMNK
jgi:hypothetical protein